MAKKQKFYVVWQGTEPGIYSNWGDCQAATKGFANARYKSFPTRAAAEAAYQAGAASHWGQNTKPKSEDLSPALRTKLGTPVQGSLCVDAAWNAETKQMEYQGVWLDDRVLAFQQGPFPKATNNIGEFLAIVHALAYLKKRSLDCAVYSDSATALAWVRKKRANSKAIAEGKTASQINELVERAESWLRKNTYANKLLKWETKAWGEIPADFGRK